MTSKGIRWIDFESCCIGPLEWDLAFQPDEVVRLFPETDLDLLALLRRLNSAARRNVVLGIAPSGDAPTRRNPPLLAAPTLWRFWAPSRDSLNIDLPHLSANWGGEVRHGEGMGISTEPKLPSYGRYVTFLPEHRRPMSDTPVAGSPSIHIQTLEHQLTQDEVVPVVYRQFLHRGQNLCLPTQEACASRRNPGLVRNPVSFYILALVWIAACPLLGAICVDSPRRSNSDLLDQVPRP